MQANSERIIELFSQAMARSSPEERARFLAEACRDEPEVRAQVESLLRAEEPARDFLRQPPPGTGPAFVLVTEKPGDRIGRYKLLQVIGEGGCGVVYEAEQEEPVRRRVALKVIKLGMDTKQVIARFEAERQALALMDHPNIAKVFDAGSTERPLTPSVSPAPSGGEGARRAGERDGGYPRPSDGRGAGGEGFSAGRPYFVMELVRGLRITDYCNQGHLATAERLKLFVQVCQAVQHAHQKGIIHRDLKPSNILVTVNDGVGVPKVIDFGIAKAIEQRLTDKSYFTAFQSFIGTPAYTSPEQAEMSSLDIDTRSDIYSLGVLLYELLTGQTPFDAEQLQRSGLDEMRRIIREVEPAKPSTRLTMEWVAVLRPRSSPSPPVAGGEGGHARRLQPEQKERINLLRGDLDWIVMKCLEKDRARRYETATGLAADIQRHLNHETVLARPASTAYRFRQLARRNKLAFAAATAVAAALVLGAAVSTWQAFKANQARDAEKAQRLTAQRRLYVANLNLVQSAWEQNNVSRVRQLLEETATAPGRGFEWFYWQRQLHQEQKTLRGHTGSILAVAYSKDGQRILTGSADQTAKLWDAASGKELLTLRGHTNVVRSVAFSKDGRRILTGSWDYTAKVWDANNGNEVLALRGHTGEVFSVAFSPDGQRIVTGSRDRTARVWDATSGTELLALRGHSNVVWSAAFSPDGQRIVTGSFDQTAKVWSATDGANLFTFRGHDGAVFSVAFSPDGERIVSGSRDLTVKVWEAATGQPLFTLTGHSGRIFSVTFSPDGQRIATAGDDQTARIWDAGNRNELLAVKRHGSRISSVAFSPDNQQIVTGGGSVNFSPNGEVINIDPGSGDQTAKVWAASNEPELLTLKGHSDAIGSVAFSPDGQRILTASFDQTAKVWEIASGKVLFTLTGHTAVVRSAAFSPDEQRIVTGSWDNTAKVWDVASRKELLPLIGHSNWIKSVTFSPDGRRIATGSDDGTARIWNAASGRKLAILEGHSFSIWSVAFSPDGQRIVTGNQDGAQDATVWDAASGEALLAINGHAARVFSVAFSPDGRRIVTGSDDHTAKVWDAGSGKLLLTLNGHSGGVMSVKYSPDGRRIVTGSQDQTAKVWDAASGEELLTLKGHKEWVLSVAFSPDGRRIATGSADRTVKLWEAASAEQVARWQQEERVATTILP